SFWPESKVIRGFTLLKYSLIECCWQLYHLIHALNAPHSILAHTLKLMAIGQCAIAIARFAMYLGAFFIAHLSTAARGCPALRAADSELRSGLRRCAHAKFRPVFDDIRAFTAMLCVARRKHLTKYIADLRAL